MSHTLRLTLGPVVFDAPFAPFLLARLTFEPRAGDRGGRRRERRDERTQRVLYQSENGQSALCHSVRKEQICTYTRIFFVTPRRCRDVQQFVHKCFIEINSIYGGKGAIDRYSPGSVSGSSVRSFSSGASFAQDYATHRVSLSRMQRAVLTAGAAAISLTNPHRGDMIACLGETTGADALSYCHQQMLATAEGRRILDEKPRVRSSTVDLDALKHLPKGTVGRIYREFLDTNVRFV